MKELIEKGFEIHGTSSTAFPVTTIRGDVRVSPALGKTPAVVICHGFKGFKDWGFFPHLARELAAAGFSAITFNFSRNGVGRDFLEFTELDKFRDNTLAREVEDLHLVLNALRGKELPLVEHIDLTRSGLIGHSRGAAAVISAAAADKTIAAVATLAGIAELTVVPDDERKRWREQGEYFVENKRTGQLMPLGLDLLEELLGPNPLERAAKALDAPLLAIHGDQDLSVPFRAAELLSGWACRAECRILPGADHTFNIRHPFAGSSMELDAVLELLKQFFKANLS